MSFLDASPSRLSVFLADVRTGAALAHRRVYAEVAVPFRVTVPPLSNRFTDFIYNVILGLDPQLTATERIRVKETVSVQLAAVLTASAQTQLIGDMDRFIELLHLALKRVIDGQGGTRLGKIPPDKLPELVNQALREVATEMGIEITPPRPPTESVWSNPLGVLTTDHAGYVSFDLTRLRPDARARIGAAIDARRAQPEVKLKTAIWVQPYGLAPIDVLAQARFGQDAIVGLLQIPGNAVPEHLGGGKALQSPSLTDWLLSPGSFAGSPEALVGADGCEHLFPSTMSVHEYLLRQVVRLTDKPEDFGVPAPHKAAYVDEYRVTWTSLGHSLGEVLYSLPLAPGETVRLAVIDWSWASVTARDEKTSVTEELRHQSHRDRTITEAVKAGLREHQHGSSFMAGTASSAGGSAGANLGVVGIGAAVGGAFSLGGSTASSDGSRDLAAENVQRLSDSFSQASSSQRELNSTVVVQAQQTEKESIQTRTFTNYNHAHTMTVLYYEVLRHFRVSVKWVRRRRAVLVARKEITWDAALARKYRALLEPAVFDPRAKAGFDALEHLLQALTDDTVNPKPKPPAIVQQQDWVITSFLFTIEVGEEETQSGVHIEARLSDGTTIPLLLEGNWNINKDELFDDNGTYPITLTTSSQVIWGKLVGVDFYVSGTDNLDLPQIGIEGFGAFGKISLRDFSGPQLSFVDANKRQTLAVKPPGPDVPVPPPPPTGKQRLTPEQNAAAERLLEHLNEFPEYYEAVVYTGRPQPDIAKELASTAWSGGGTVLDHVDPIPLEIFGNHVAFPLASQPPGDDELVLEIAAALDGPDPIRRQWALEQLAAMTPEQLASVLQRLPLAAARSERLMTLPTRGVFAEGRLGHCSVAEEIDDTRFWKWDEHPLPIEAPEIAPVTPVTPTPQKVDATPTAFPQSLVNIVNPSPAPDPTGLSAALSVLGTPNIFRDMSGRQEVADLLKKLSDNTISIAEAANKARDIQAKYGVDLDKQAKEHGLGLAKVQAENEKAKLEVEKEKAHQVTPSEAQHAIKLSESERNKGNKTDEEHKQTSKTVQSNIKGAQPPPAKPAKRKKIQFDLKGWGDIHIVGQWRLDLDQRGTAVAFVIETATNPSGVVIVEVPNEFNDNRYSVSIAGEVLAGYGINARLRVRNLLLEFPPDKYKANDYLYVVLKATTDKFHTKASSSDEATKKFSQHYGVTPEIGYKDIIKITGEGGWTWEKEGKKTAGHEMEMDVYYYTGGFTVESYA